MDEAASLRGAVGHALLLDFHSGTDRQVRFDPAAEGLNLLVIDTRAHHELVDGQYGARRASCIAAAGLLGVASLREVTDLGSALAALDDPVLRRRMRHVVTEIARTAQFVELLEAGELRLTGPLLDASHASLRDDYEVSAPELDVAVEAARHAGALGARMTGGGFGGSAIALIEAGAEEPVAAAVRDAFAARGFNPPAFLLSPPSGPAGRVA
jgi:galactokinase